jgi:hypothetical protein
MKDPGPGNYEVHEGSRGPSYSFHPRREERRDNSSPGPGEYDAQSEVIKDRVKSYQMS